MYNDKGFFFVANNDAHLKGIKLLLSNGCRKASIMTGTVTNDCKDSQMEVAQQVFCAYNEAQQYAAANGGKVYHCLPSFIYALGTALEVCGVSDTGQLISIDDAIAERDKHFKEHCCDETE